MYPQNTTTRILRMKDLPHKVGLQPSTIYELIANDKFPRPFKITPNGRAAGWFEREIDSWLLEQKASSGVTKC